MVTSIATKHSDARLDDKDFGLVADRAPGRIQRSTRVPLVPYGSQGRNVDLAATSGTSCAWCHAHDSIANVSAHGHSLRVRWKPLQNFLKDFSHKGHLEDTLKHLREARESAQRMRSPARKQAAEKTAMELAGVLDRSGQHLNCRSCHLVSAPSARRRKNLRS